MLFKLLGLLAAVVLNIFDIALFYVLFWIKGDGIKVHDLRNVGTDKYKFKAKAVDTAPTIRDETKPYRTVTSMDKLLETPSKEITTVGQLFEVCAQKFKHKPCFGTRSIIKIHNEYRTDHTDGTEKPNPIPEFGPLVWQDYSTAYKRVNHIASGLVQFTGLNSQDRIGIFEETCQEWMMVAQGCLRYGITIVTVYANLGDEALVAAFNETQITTIFTTDSRLTKFKDFAKQLPSLKYIIYNKRFKQDTTPEIVAQQIQQETSIKVICVDDVEALGASTSNAPPIRNPPTSDSLALIMYTSGTTGMPKGVMITHKNILAAIAGLQQGIGNDPEVEPVYIAYLPLAHILELVAEHFVLFEGGCIGYGSPKTLTERGAKPVGDLIAIKPTVMCGVPRVYDTVKKSGTERISKRGSFAQWLFNTAYAARKSALLVGRETPLWNLLVFNNFRTLIGGKIKLMISGGAALSAESHEFMRICVGCCVVQGYGLTETCAATAVQNGYHEFTTCRVGAPTPCNEVKLVSVPELKYSVTDSPLPRGEICVRGPNITLGYYNQPDKTKEVYTSDGWFYTGDIGELHNDGTLSVIDRKKSIVKLDNGEYVALEKLESFYMNSPFVAPNGICIHADSSHSHIVALVLLQPTYVTEWAKAQSIAHSDNLSELCKNKQVQQAVLSSLQNEAQKNKLRPFEFVRAVTVLPDEWTSENGMLTASNKLQRQSIYAKYKMQIESMYAK